jgi:hypothetical protein
MGRPAARIDGMQLYPMATGGIQRVGAVQRSADVALWRRDGPRRLHGRPRRADRGKWWLSHR